jgi:2-hydroxychromene-2-carboxylate isomerase
MRLLVVTRPTPIAIHEQRLWDQWAARDAAAIAPFYELQFTPAAAPPSPAVLDLARRVLLVPREATTQAELAVRIGGAVQQNDRAALEQMGAEHGVLEPRAAEAVLETNYRLRHRLGHYLGGMFYYAGEWYWGIDRLHHLEARLDALGARRAGAPDGPSVQLTRRAPQHIDGNRRLTLEFFPSLRSPYTHLSYDRVADLCKRYPVELVVRPVLPMMMRGVKADRRKGVYILRDTQREAEHLGVAFGDIWDPFGKPVLRAYSLFPWARDQGRGFEYLHAYSRAVWSERINAWHEDGLRQIVQRAGLDWEQARKILDNRDWEAELETNVQDMIAAGAWGVPTFRLLAAADAPEFTLWGQDRLWRIEEEIARRLDTSTSAE